MEAGGDFFQGTPVPVDPARIDRELSRLWKPARPGEAPGPSAVRACVANLIFHLPRGADGGCLGLISEVGRRFPSRMLLLARRERGAGAPHAAPADLSASIAALCRLAPGGGLPVCCEQIMLESAGEDLAVLAGAVRPLLVPDVPVVLVLLEAGGEELAHLLEDCVERIVTDSRQRPVRALRFLDACFREHPECGRFLCDDLAWHATLPLRRVLRDLFDEKPVRQVGEGLREVHVTFRRAGEARDGEGGAAAALLAGWLASRLGRSPRVVFRAQEREGFSPGDILSVELTADPAPGARQGGQSASLRVDLESEETFRISLETPLSCILPRRIPHRRLTDAALLGGALQRPERQNVLRGALEGALQLEESVCRGVKEPGPGSLRQVSQPEGAAGGEGERVLIFSSAEGAMDRAADTLVEICEAVPERKITLALSGGSTPELLYRKLAETYARRVEWRRLEIFFGDERAVPSDHAESNYRMAREALLDAVPVPEEQVHRMPADGDLVQAAVAYEQEIRRVVPPGPGGVPSLDLLWLGLGADGHTASLFAGAAALEEEMALVACSDAPSGMARLTVTLVLINAARRVQFLVTGRGKSAVVRDLLEPAGGREDAGSRRDLPAARVRPVYGRLEWLLDRDAAAGIQDPGLIA